jgi:uncharacterized protein (TIGR02145 family)
MKKLLLALTLTTALASCKKETSNSSNSGSSSSSLVSTIDCSSSQPSGVLKKGEQATLVSFQVNYLGGNGKTYYAQSIKSTGVLGLTATLIPGTLANGNGSVTYVISGTPTSTGTAYFAIDLGGKSCTVSINVEEGTQASVINFTSIGAPVGSFQNNVSDVDGNTYKTVKIGTQVWMAENLKTTKFSDGTRITNVVDNTQWENNTTGAWSYYENNAANNAKYGKLYNWYAVSQTTNGNKNICPKGWHVASDFDWVVLSDYLGDNFCGKMKEIGTTSWNSPNSDATNTSLFTGIPGGYRDSNGDYGRFGDCGGLWSSSEYSSNKAGYLYLSSYGNMGSYDSDRRAGLSVRCLRD